MKKTFFAVALAGMCAVSANAACTETVSISDKDGLDAFRNRVNAGENTLCAKLEADITYNEQVHETDAPYNLIVYKYDVFNTKVEYNSWTPIEGFAGTFDGKGKSIKGLYLSTETDAGFFKSVYGGAVIKNLRITDTYFRVETERAGGIIAQIASDPAYNSKLVLVENVSFAGSVVGGNTVAKFGTDEYNGGKNLGGLIGLVSNGIRVTISNSVNAARVLSSYQKRAGESKVVDEITANMPATNVGGLIGLVEFGATANIANCYNTGKVDAKGGSYDATVATASGIVVKDNVACLSGVSGCASSEAKSSSDLTSDFSSYKQEKLFSYYDAATVSSIVGEVPGVTFSDDKTDASILIATISDEEESISIPQKVTVDKVVLTRKYVKDALSTIVLPFSIKASKVSNARFYNFAGINKSGSPWSVDMAPLCDYENAGCTGTETLEANHPYYVKRVDAETENSPLTFDGSVTLLATSGNPAEYRGQMGETYADGLTYANDWVLQGVYAKKTWSEGDAELGSVYGQAAKDKDGSYRAGDFIKAGKNSFIKPLRAYLVHRNAPTAGAKKRALTKTDAEEELPSVMTYNILPYKAVESINQGSETDPEMEGPLGIVKAQKIPANMLKMDCWFDVKGRNMSKPSAQGAYINNRTTVIVK